MDSKFTNADLNSENNENSQDVTWEQSEKSSMGGGLIDNAELDAQSNGSIYARANAHVQASTAVSNEDPDTVASTDLSMDPNSASGMAPSTSHLGTIETSRLTEGSELSARQTAASASEKAAADESLVSETTGFDQAKQPSQSPSISTENHRQQTAAQAFEELDEGLFGIDRVIPVESHKSMGKEQVVKSFTKVREGVNMSENQLPQIDQAVHTSVEAEAPLSQHDIDIAANYAANMARFGQGGLQVGTSPRQLKWPGKVLAVFLAVLVGLTSWNTLAIAEARSIFIQDDATSLASSPDEEIIDEATDEAAEEPTDEVIDETGEGEPTPEDEAAQEGGDEATSPGEATPEGETAPEGEAPEDATDESSEAVTDQSAEDQTPEDETTDESSEETADEATSDYAEYLPTDLVNADQVIPYLSESLTSGNWNTVINNASVNAANESLAEADKIDAESYLADTLAQHFNYSLTPSGALQASDQSFQIQGSSLVLTPSLGNLDALLEGGYLGAADESDVVALTFTAPYVYRQQPAADATSEEAAEAETNPTYVQTLSREEWLANGGDTTGARVAISASDIPAGWSVWTEHDGKYLKATKQTLAEGLSGSIVLRYEGLQDENGITINETRGRLYANAVMPSLVVTIAGDMPITQELPIYAGYMVQSFNSATGEAADDAHKSVYYAAANSRAATVWVNSAEAMADLTATINCEADPIYMGEGVGYAPYTITMNAFKGDVYEYGYALRLEDRPDANGLGGFIGEDIVAVDVTDWTNEEIGAIDPLNPETYLVADMPTVTVEEPGVATINFIAPEESTLVAEEPTSRRVLYVAVPYAETSLNLSEGSEWYDATQLTMSVVADVNSELVQEETWDDSASWEDVLDNEDAFIYTAPTTQDVWFYVAPEREEEEPTDEGDDTNADEETETTPEGEESTDESEVFTTEDETLTEDQPVDEETTDETTEPVDTETEATDETTGDEAQDENQDETTPVENETGDNATDEPTDEATEEPSEDTTEPETEESTPEPEVPATPDPASFLPEGLIEANQVLPSLSADLSNTEIEGVQNSASAQATGSVDSLRSELESRFNYDVLVSGAPKTVATNVYHIGGSALRADMTLGDLTTTLKGGTLGGVNATDAVAFTFNAPYIYVAPQTAIATAREVSAQGQGGQNGEGESSGDADDEGDSAAEGENAEATSEAETDTAAEGDTFSDVTYTQTLSREEWLANGGDANGGRVALKADAIPEGWTIYTEHDGKYLEATQETLAAGLSGTIVMRYTGNDGKLSAESVLPSFDIVIDGTVPESETLQVTGGYIIQTYTPAAAADAPAADEAPEAGADGEAAAGETADATTDEAVYYALIQNTAVAVDVDSAAPVVNLTSETTALTDEPTVDEQGGFAPYLITMQATDGALAEPTYTVNLQNAVNADDVVAFDVTGWTDEEIAAIDPYDEETFANVALATASQSEDGQVSVTYEPETTELAANAEPVALYLAVPYDTTDLTITEDEETYEPVSVENQVAAEGAVDGEEIVFETAPVALTSTFSFAARAMSDGPQGIAPTATSDNNGTSTVNRAASNSSLDALLGGSSSLFNRSASSALAPQPGATVSTKTLSEVQFNPSLVISGEVGEDLGSNTYLINSSQTPTLSLQLESAMGTTAFFGGYSAYGSTYYGTYDANKGYVKNDRTYCNVTGAPLFNSIDEALAQANADGYDVKDYDADTTGIDGTIVEGSTEYKVLALAFYNKMRDREGYMKARTRFLLNVPYMYTEDNGKGGQATNQTYDYAAWKAKTGGYNNETGEAYGTPANPTVGHLMAVNFGTNNKTILNYWSVYLRIYPTQLRDKETGVITNRGTNSPIDVCLDEYIMGTGQNDISGLAELFYAYPEYDGINFSQGFTGELVFEWHGALKSSSPTGYEEQMSLNGLNQKVPNCDVKLLGQIPENGGASLTLGGETYVCTNVQGKKSDVYYPQGSGNKIQPNVYLKAPQGVGYNHFERKITLLRTNLNWKTTYKQISDNVLYDRYNYMVYKVTTTNNSTGTSEIDYLTYFLKNFNERDNGGQGLTTTDHMQWKYNQYPTDPEDECIEDNWYDPAEDTENEGPRRIGIKKNPITNKYERKFGVDLTETVFPDNTEAFMGVPNEGFGVIRENKVIP